METTRTLNLYGRPIQRTSHELNFVCAAYVPGGDLYWGFIVDDTYLPVSSYGGDHLTLIERHPCTGTLDIQTGTFTQVDLGEARVYEREAKPFGGRMSLAKLATVCAYTIERDVVETASYVTTHGLAQYVSEHVVRLAYNARLIGGDELDADMRHLHDVLGADTMDARCVEGSFLAAWKRAWADNRRRHHGNTVRLITSLMVAMNRETAERAVSDFVANGSKLIA